MKYLDYWSHLWVLWHQSFELRLIQKIASLGGLTVMVSSLKNLEILAELGDIFCLLGLYLLCIVVLLGAWFPLFVILVVQRVGSSVLITASWGSTFARDQDGLRLLLCMRISPVFPNHSNRVLLSKVYLFSFAAPLCTVLLCGFFNYADYLIHKVKFLLCQSIHEEIVKFQFRRVVEQLRHHFKNGFHKIVVVLLSQLKLALNDYICDCLVIQQKRIVDQRQVRLCIPLQQPTNCH